MARVGVEAGSPPRVPRRNGVLALLALFAVLVFAGFIALGTWQVERRAWKLDLIARVQQRVHAAPAPPPSREAWAASRDARSDEYRHLRLSGTFDHERETLVQAVTELGAGFWVMTPLRRADGSVVLVNRGFVPPGLRDRATRLAGEPGGVVTVTGLLRLTEPGGGFLRRNDPAAGHWYSRDVQAIAASRGLDSVAPYFVDAEETAPAGQGAGPVGGLTVIAFHNSHLVYALTWYALALMVAAAAWAFARHERRLRWASQAGGRNGASA